MRHLLLIFLPCLVLAGCTTMAEPAAPAAPERLALAQHASAAVSPGVTLTYEGVDDSRCPPDVRCVWAGTLSYRFSVQGKTGTPEHFTLVPERPAYTSAMLGGARIELDAALVAAPPPREAAGTTPVTLRIQPPRPANTPA